MARKRKHEVLPPKYTANRVDRGGLLCANHTRRLDSLIAIASEMGRVYRSTINGLISTSDGARLIYQLKEIRGVREAVNAEAALNAAKEAATPVPFTVNVISVPSGHFEQQDGSFAPDIPGHLQIEHAPQQISAPTEEELKPQERPDPTLQLSALEAKLLAMGHGELLKLAEALDVGR